MDRAPMTPELTETERRAIKSVVSMIEEGTHGIGPIDGPFIVLNPDERKPHALRWDDDSVKRLFKAIREAASKHFESASFYEAESVKRYEQWWYEAASKKAEILEQVKLLRAVVESLPLSYKNVVDVTYEERMGRIKHLLHRIEEIGEKK